MCVSLLNSFSCHWSLGSVSNGTSLNGFAAGPAETIAPAVIADIFFLHDRGKYNTLYFVTYFGSLMVSLYHTPRLFFIWELTLRKVGPIVAGAMAEKIGWRSFWWLNVGLFGLSFLTTVFLFPETKRHRPHLGEADNQSATSQSVSTPKEGNLDNQIEDPNSLEVSSICLPNLAAIETAQKDPYLGVGTPSKQQFKLFQPKDTHTSLLNEILTPWKLMALPIVQFAAFVVSWSASCFLTINLTQSQNFAFPPYNYSSLIIGKCGNLLKKKILLLMSDRILQLRSPHRRLHWALYCWSPLRLDLDTTDSPQQWHP